MEDPRHYGGPNGSHFWKRVRRLPDRWGDTLAELGLILQDVEGRVLMALRRAEREAAEQRKAGRKAT